MSEERRPEGVGKGEAARRLAVSVRTLERLLESGELDGVRDGPRGGLRPTRASVERRLEQLEASTPVPDVEVVPVAAESAPVAPNDDATAMVSPAETAEASVAPPMRRLDRLVRGGRRAGARLLRCGRRQVMRALRHVAKRPARAARCVIAAGLIAGLIALGVTRERPGAATSRDDVTLLVITSREDGEARHRTRLRCGAASGEPVKVYVRRGRRARCVSAGARRAR